MPVSVVAKALDISSNNHNGHPFNWHETKAAGYDAVYVKATQGDSYVNPYFIADCRDARNAGLEVGIYHYWIKGLDPAKQIAWFKLNGIEQVKLYTTLVPCLDVENGSPDETLEEELIQATDLLGDHIVYMDRNFYENIPGHYSTSDWLAWPGWTPEDGVPNEVVVMVQTGKVVVPGIGMDVNGKQWSTDVDSILDWSGIMALAESKLNAPIVAAASNGKGGYWLVGADGGVFAYGGTEEYGSLAGTHLDAPIVAIMVSETGLGFALVAGDGGVFCYGDFAFKGSIPT